ncbi:hypothetical protein AVEN_110005-1 [Araneus ventricosus]|uniref:Uncharacterized protein n=1 Tax=Araneus ventricosus TaxID=182803 RepID=A0A4Y2JA15_ARAVE|nr:hypothetical protein AVEN_110005-1 [Araneus ventricosus]
MDTVAGKFRRGFFFFHPKESQWHTRMVSSSLAEEDHPLIDDTALRARRSKLRNGTCNVDLSLSKRVETNKCRVRQLPCKQALHSSLMAQSFIYLKKLIPSKKEAEYRNKGR